MNHFMADLSERQRELNQFRQLHKAERQTAREIARDHAATAINQLARSCAPEWFSSTQDSDYRDELIRLMSRI